MVGLSLHQQARHKIFGDPYSQTAFSRRTTRTLFHPFFLNIPLGDCCARLSNPFLEHLHRETAPPPACLLLCCAEHMMLLLLCLYFIFLFIYLFACYLLYRRHWYSRAFSQFNKKSNTDNQGTNSLTLLYHHSQSNHLSVELVYPVSQSVLPNSCTEFSSSQLLGNIH